MIEENELIAELLMNTEMQLESHVERLRRDLRAVRTGRAHTSILDAIRVDYYGTPTPLHQVATLSAPEPTLIVIQPWEASMIKKIEKAIMTSDLGLNPSSDGRVIRLAIPPLTEERRKELAKKVKALAETAKIGARAARRDAKDHLKKAEKASEISEDEARRAFEKVEALTEKTIKDIDEIAQRKVAEILDE